MGFFVDPFSRIKVVVSEHMACHSPWLQPPEEGMIGRLQPEGWGTGHAELEGKVAFQQQEQGSVLSVALGPLHTAWYSVLVPHNWLLCAEKPWFVG